MEVNDTGRKLCGECLSPDLCKGTTLPIFQSSGIQPVSSDCVNNFVKNIEQYNFVLIRNLELMLSTPHDDVTFCFSIKRTMPEMSNIIGSIESTSSGWNAG